MIRLKKHHSLDCYDYYKSVLKTPNNRISTEGILMVVFVFLFGLLMVGGIIVHHYK